MIPLTTKSRSAIRIFWRSLETTHSAIALVPLEDAGQHQQWSCQRLQQNHIFFSPPFAGNREIVKRRPNCSSDKAVGVPLRICAVLSKHHLDLLLLMPPGVSRALPDSIDIHQLVIGYTALEPRPKNPVRSIEHNLGGHLGRLPSISSLTPYRGSVFLPDEVIKVVVGDSSVSVSRLGFSPDFGSLG